jgi:hypothetical protein
METKVHEFASFNKPSKFYKTIVFLKFVLTEISGFQMGKSSDIICLTRLNYEKKFF